MKKLLITLLLISPFSFADWGDVYYCQETANSVTTNKGKRIDYELGKFIFKLDKTKNAMVFTEVYYGGKEMELRVDASNPSGESWYADSMGASAGFHKNSFLLSAVGLWITSISADCEKF